MVLLARINALFGIAASTGFLCVQQFTKKGIILKNFTSSLSGSEPIPQGEVAQNQVGLVKKKSMIQNMKTKYQNTKQKVQQIKQKGNGSYYQGVKKIYQQKKSNQNTSLPEPVPNKTAMQLMKQRYQLSKQAMKQLKESGKGSYYQGFKIMYKQYQAKSLQTPINLNNATSNQSAKTQGYSNIIMSKINKFRQLYKKASDAKNEKLVQNHLIFGATAMAGSILMPKIYMFWNLAYFVTYQLYYFGEIISEKKGIKNFQNMRFIPVWQGFMFGSIFVFAGGLFKIAKALS